MCIVNSPACSYATLVHYSMQALEGLWHYCHTCRLIWIMAWRPLVGVERSASQAAVGSTKMGGEPNLSFRQIASFCQPQVRRRAVVSAKRSNGCLKLATSSPRFQVQFETTKLSSRHFSRGSCFS